MPGDEDAGSQRALTAANAATMRSSTAASLTLCTDEMEPSSCSSGLLSEMELAACLQLYAAWKSIKSLLVVVFFCSFLLRLSRQI